MTYGADIELESRPTLEQQGRLTAFLSELMLVSRKYGLLVDTYADDDKPVVRDLRTDTVVGLGLCYFLDPEDDQHVTSYEVEHSILDGDWMVDGPDGPVELRRANGAEELFLRRAHRRSA